MASLKVFYGWVIVGAAMVVTCIGFGAMFSLGVFLQPMSADTGWSRTGISTAALLNFLCMGVGSFVWGALSDRLGTTTPAPLARWIITNYDWRTAMLVIGDLAWLFIIPAALLVREPPASATAGLSGATTAADDPGLTAGQALRTPQFAAIAFTYFACCAAHSGPIFHMV